MNLEGARVGPWLFIVCVVLASIAFPILVSYVIDVRLHGVNVFTRRRVLKTGVEAPAKVLSAEMVVRAVRSRGTTTHSIIYEVSPPNHPTFRAKGVEVMYPSEWRANDISVGATVTVRCDPATKVVVLVRAPRESVADRDAKRRAKEEALLKGGR